MKEKFAERLIEAMDDKKMTLSDLSRRSGIDKSSISRYRSGNYNPGKKNFFILSDVLDVNPAWLAGEDAPKQYYSQSLLDEDEEDWEKAWYKNPLSNRFDTLSDFENDLLNAYHKADPAIQSAVRKLLDIEEEQETT